MDSSKYIRNKFIHFFEKNDHYSYNHSPLAPSSYDTTLFTIAGMKQFNNYFLGKEKAPFQNICSIQPCLRLNDLQNVGKTKRHHTFFEMLGSFSFGGYFKEKAIDLAFKFLVEELGIDLQYLYFTVHISDKESYDIWKMKVPESKIIFINSDDNFWRAGTFGPCGPCSEIYFDTEKSINVSKKEVEDSILSENDRFLEIWNIVFMEYNQEKDGLKPLQMKCVDTGMGLERITSIYDEIFHNFKTDLFNKIIEKIQIKNNNFEECCLVADHMRAIIFLLNENLRPKNEGQGYVLRNLIRRSYLYYKNLLDLLPIVAESLDFYGNFNSNFIYETLEKEISDFQNILEKAEEIIEKTDNIDAYFVFKLYDTYGMPIEISKNILKNHEIDWNMVEKLKTEHSNKSKKKLHVDFDKFTKQLDYDTHTANAKVLFIGELDGLDVYEKNEISEGKFVLITNESCFYGRGGGQEGDRGIVKNNLFFARVTDTIKQKTSQTNYILIHICEIEAGTIKKDMEIQMEIDIELRQSRTRAHSTTHLFGEYFMRKYGYEISGSFVDNDYLRMDFVIKDNRKNLKDILDEGVQYVEKSIKEEVNSIITEEKFENVQNAIFGDRCNYGEIVRVIEFPGYSKQLCGGTHVKNTKDIGKLLVIKESAISSGVRRVEILTNNRVDEYIEQKKLQEKTKIHKPLVIMDHLHNNNLEMIITEGGVGGQINKLSKENTILINHDEKNTKFIFNGISDEIINDFIKAFKLKGGGKIIKHYGSSNFIPNIKLTQLFSSFKIGL